MGAGFGEGKRPLGATKAGRHSRPDRGPYKRLLSDLTEGFHPVMSLPCVARVVNSHVDGGPVCDEWFFCAFSPTMISSRIGGCASSQPVNMGLV